MATVRIMKRVEKELSQTKVILRHLPPDLLEESLKEFLRPLPAHSHFYYVPAGSISSYSRAYINITDDNQHSIERFRDRFDGVQLKSEKGVKHRIIVEFAPFQCVSHAKAKPDPRCATILDDPDYQSFLEQYNNKAEPLQSVDLSYLDTLDKVNEIQPTPLVEYIKGKRGGARYAHGRGKVTHVVSDKKKKSTKVIEVKTKNKSKTTESTSTTTSTTSTTTSSTNATGTNSTTTTTANSNGNDGGSGSSSSTKEKKSRRVEKPVIIVHENPRKTKKSSEESLKNRERSDQALYVPKGRSRNETERGRNDERKKSGGTYKGDGYYGGGGSPSPRSSRPPRSPSGYRNSRHDNQYQFHEDDGDDYQGPDYAGGGTSGDRGRRDDRHDNRHYGNKRNYYNDRRSYK